MPEVILLGGKELEGGEMRLSGYVPTATIAVIEALGATVRVLKNEGELDAHIEELYALLEDDEPPVG